jgi:dTMP kinase
MTAVGGRRGPFITFEGGDGAGKSTHIHRLAARLRAAGHEVVVTREPGGSPGAEELRPLLLGGDPDRWSPLAEALLMYAARADHLQRTINPARARGAVVLCDRFSDSTAAYQGVAGGIGPENLSALEALVVGEDGPDLTIILDVPVEAALARKGAEAHRFEAKGGGFQERVRQAYRDIAARAPDRCAVIDAARPLDEVARDIETAVRARLDL